MTSSIKGLKVVGYFDCPGGGQVVARDGTAYVGHVKPPNGTTTADSGSGPLADTFRARSADTQAITQIYRVLPPTDPEDVTPAPVVLSAQPGDRIGPYVLREALGEVVFAAATDESRPILTGVLTRLEGDTMTLAAADNYRIAVRTVTLAKPVPAETTITLVAGHVARGVIVFGE